MPEQELLEMEILTNQLELVIMFTALLYETNYYSTKQFTIV
jgi:hypothetical protein